MAANVSHTEIEHDLVTYLKNILKYQIIPMDCMNLRALVKEAPNSTKLQEFVEEKYPGTLFVDFLKLHPDVFTLNPNRSVVLTEGNDFTLPHAVATKFPDQIDGCDEVDGYDKAEYVSDSDSEDSGGEEEKLLKKQQQQQSRRAADRVSVSSSDSESSVEFFSSEIVHTSDSDHSSLSSTSSLSNS